MKIKLIIDPSMLDEEIEVHAKAYTKEVERVMQQLQASANDSIDAYQQDKIHLLKKDDIYSIAVEDGKVYFFTEEEEYEAKRKLYELEALLQEGFVRVNKSTLVNMSKISYMQMEKFGMMELVMENETTVHVSRKYLPKLKERLGIGGK